MSTEYFLLIDAIDGDATEVGHEGAIRLITWSWGVSAPARPGGGGGAVAGRPDFDELQVVTTISRASPQLVESCVRGRHHRTASLTGIRAGGELRFAFIRYDLGDVRITSVEHGDADDEPIEELALAYRELSIAHTSQQPDGSAGTVTTFSHP